MLSDSKFINQPPNGKKYDRKDFLGIADGEKWDLEHIAELIGSRRPPEDNDPLPAGTVVEFNAPDGTLYRGKVASKSGDDYYCRSRLICVLTIDGNVNQTYG